jgi:AraC family transcriptional regulator of adaptative response / DNA-3-methyladenine glycosylase II
LNPVALRKQRKSNIEAGVVLQLGFRPPFAWAPLIRFLAGRSVANTEAIIGERDDKYVRALRVGKHIGWIAAERSTANNLLRIEVAPSLLSVLPEIQTRLRRLFDLDANPAVIDSHLASDKTLRSHIKTTPGLRVPGAFNGFELALRAVLGQQISVKAATTVYGRFVDTFGHAVQTPFTDINRVPPTAADVANANLQQLIDRGLTRKRAETVSALACAVADNKVAIDPAADFATTRAALQALPGIGPWTAEYIAMRALGDPDAFLHSDLGLMHALKIDKPAKLLAAAEHWRPWRAYAALHLWNGLNQGG